MRLRVYTSIIFCLIELLLAATAQAQTPPNTDYQPNSPHRASSGNAGISASYNVFAPRAQRLNHKLTEPLPLLQAVEMSLPGNQTININNDAVEMDFVVLSAAYLLPQKAAMLDGSTLCFTGFQLAHAQLFDLLPAHKRMDLLPGYTFAYTRLWAQRNSGANTYRYVNPAFQMQAFLQLHWLPIGKPSGRRLGVLLRSGWSQDFSSRQWRPKTDNAPYLTGLPLSGWFANVGLFLAARNTR